MTRLQRSIVLLLSLWGGVPLQTACAQVIGATAYQESRSVRQPVDPLREPYMPVQAQPLANPAAQAPGAVSGGELYVALVGAVEGPAVYRLTRAISHVELIELTGGPTQLHSSTVVLIRQGRPQTLLYNPKYPAAAEASRLQDGDVVVLQAQPGVRQAVYETTQSLAPGARPHQGVSTAHRASFVHVACVGLAPHPVVLPLNPHQATQHVLLRDLLGMSADAVQRGVKVLTDGTRFSPDDSLYDGAVLLFDRRVLGPQEIHPIEAYPPARDLPASSPDSPQPTSAPNTAAGPQTSGLAQSPVEPVSAPFARAPREAGPAAAPSTALGTGLTPRPLTLPGVPFEVGEPAPPGSATANTDIAAATPPDSAAAHWRATRTSGGPAAAAGPDRVIPIDITSQPAPVPAAGATHLQTAYEHKGGAGARSFSDRVDAELEGDGVEQPTNRTGTASVRDIRESTGALAAVGPSRSIANFDWVIVVATAFGACLCVVGSISWIRAQQQRRQAATPASPSDCIAAASPLGTPLPPGKEATLLQELVDHRLPLVEEQTGGEAGVRLFGPIVGHRKLYFDPPHAGPRGPQFASRTSATERRPVPRQVSALRVLRHLEAARRSARTPATPLEPVSAPPMYDVIQPEAPAASPVTASAAAAASTTATPRSDVRTTARADFPDRLGRALQAIHEVRR